MMNRKNSRLLVLLFMAAIASFSIFSIAGWTEGTSERPNVVLITVASTGAERLPCYGAEWNTTPTWCGLAREGTLYERAYTPSSWDPLALAAISAGRYPFEIGAYNEFSDVRNGHDTLLTRLSDSGYTVHITEELGRWQLTDDYLDFSMYDPNTTRPRHRDNEGDAYIDIGPVIPESQLSAVNDVFGRTAGPDIIWHHEAGPHYPYDIGSPPYHFLTQDAGLPVNVSSMAEYMVRRYGEGNRSALAPAEQRYLRAYYRESLWHMDRTLLGPLVDSLQTSGRYDDTLIIVAAAHGTSLGENGIYSHLGPYDENVRVPLIIKYPGQRQSRRVSRPVSLLDILPTVLQATATPYDAVEFTGRALLRPSDREWVLSQDSGQRVIVNATHKAAVCIQQWCRSRLYHFRYSNAGDIAVNATPATRDLLHELQAALEARAHLERGTDLPERTRSVLRERLQVEDGAEIRTKRASAE